MYKGVDEGTGLYRNTQGLKNYDVYFKHRYLLYCYCIVFFFESSKQTNNHLLKMEGWGLSV